jgi:hypothetical protein
MGHGVLRVSAARLCLKASTLAIAATLPSYAFAQCAPDPTQTSTAVICSGTDSNGILVNTNASPLTVSSGASVSNAGAAAISVAIPASSSSYTRSATITVNGSVSATGAAGISVLSGPLGTNSYDFYGTYAAVTVGTGATVSGTTGIALGQSAGWPYANTYATLDNAGTISGTSGIALSTSGNYASFTSIINRSGGTIGAIAGVVNAITNEGTIAGGSLSAINSTGTLITNKGTISSSNLSGATILAQGPYYSVISLTNSGAITNTGTGGALSATNITLTNQSGGTISSGGASVLDAGVTGYINAKNAGSITSTATGTVLLAGQIQLANASGATIGTGAGGTAISAGNDLNLTNAGTINGNVTAGLAPSYVTGSMVDSTAGTINGSLTFGAGNDTLVAKLNNGSLYTGITGTINGGGGSNTLSLQTSADVTLSSAIALPTNFGILALSPNSGTTLTLANGFTNNGTIAFTGLGTLDNQTSLSGTGTIINGFGIAGTIRNSATITSNNLGGGTAVTAAGYAGVNNAGTILATGNGVSPLGGGLINSGTITAGGTAITSFGDFANSGTIRSTGGTGASISFSCNCASGTNSGTISGTTVGVVLGGGILINTGSILSSGTAFQSSAYSTLDNRAGGVVTGGVMAVAGAGFANKVINAGTINGNVDLANGASAYQYYNTNTYYAVSGGVLNGNLRLGQGDTLITDLLNTGTGAFAGITGTVSANNSSLIYNVNADASATTALPSGFTSLGYQLINGASLSLTGTGALTNSLSVSGIGSLNLGGSLSSTTGPVIVMTTAQTANGLALLPALSITNNGSIALTRNTDYYPQAAVVLGSGAGFVNNGSILVNDTVASSNAATSAISLYGTLVNTGTITANGAQGVVIGSTWTTANTNPDTTLGNSGAIIADGAAITTYGNVDITNSGTITSRTSNAINTLSGYNSTVTNLAGGTISGVGTALQMVGGMVNNAGTINGNVTFNRGTGGIYVANGGTLNGNLNFGYGVGILVETGSGYGVTGQITGTMGSVGHQRSGTTTVTLGGTLPEGFTREFTVAAGASSRVTITGPSSYAGEISVGGDGTIINQLATTGSVYGLGSSSIGYTPYANTALAGFVNQANVRSVYLATSLFSNAATIGASTLVGSAVSLFTDKGFAFTNSGAILNSGNYPAVYLSGSATTSSTISNSGTINGGMVASITGTAGTGVTIVNSGTITSYTQRYYTFDPITYSYKLNTLNTALLGSTSGVDSINVSNSGVITGDITLLDAPVSLADTGTITGKIVTGTGNDSFRLGGAFTGALDGGAGTNTLAIGGGNQAFSAISNIATLTQSGGFASVSGTATLGLASLSGGRLVGLGGSVINASTITVGSGATFGSAGTINGNVLVSGILSPGASPGTMTVNGNVTLSNGSTSLFEITPSAQDKLVVNGKLVIASGSTLQIAATTPVKAGTTLSLISATDGVTGTFDTVTGLPGVVKARANGDLGLLVQFANGSGYAPQVQRAISYVNKAMAASSAPAALFPALNSLQDGNGVVIAPAFARITPEPYADAMEIGVETALSLAASVRGLGAGEDSGPGHIFAFGQALGSLRQFSGDHAQGVSSARVNGYGTLGGLGYAGAGYALSGYVGWMDQSQSIATLAASTSARGVVGGLALRLGDKATRVTLAAAYDGAQAITRRMVPDAGQITGSYRLPTVSLDAAISHDFTLSQGWLLRPQLGATWVMTHRRVLSEFSAHPFALSVDQATRRQGFIDAGLSFESSQASSNLWHRFLTLGMRYRLENEIASAAAGLAGSGYGLVAYGVGRDRLSATIAAGLEYRIAAGASIFLNAAGDLGQTGQRESASLGVRWHM